MFSDSRQQSDLALVVIAQIFGGRRWRAGSNSTSPRIRAPQPESVTRQASKSPWRGCRCWSQRWTTLDGRRWRRTRTTASIVAFGADRGAGGIVVVRLQLGGAGLRLHGQHWPGGALWMMSTGLTDRHWLLWCPPFPSPWGIGLGVARARSCMRTPPGSGPAGRRTSSSAPSKAPSRQRSRRRKREKVGFRTEEG